MLDRSGRHLLAGPRTPLLDERAAELRVAAQARDLVIPIIPIHSRQSAYGTVDRRIQDTLAGIAPGDHAIVLVTHEALLGLDPVLLADWHVGIDELPETAILSGTFWATTTWSSLERQYAILPSEEVGWWQVVPREDVDVLTRREITAGGPGLAPFHFAAQNQLRQVYVDLPDWREARRPKRPIRWWSVWTPMQLKGCASVTITGASMEDSLIWHACRHIHDENLSWEFVEVGVGQVRARPTIRVHYFVEHAGSTEWWETDEGSRCLVEISRYLEHIGFDGYWSANKTVRPYFRHRLGGQWVEPKQSGSNALRNYTSCCIIYSSKAQLDDEPILEVLGLDRETIKLTREYEDVMQFTLRGAIRNNDYGGTYDVYLYDAAQAAALRDKFLETGITDSIELIAVEEVGILDVARPRPPRASRNPTADTRSPQGRREQDKAVERERGRRRRADDKAKRQQDGTHRKPGRPRKTEDRPQKPPHDHHTRHR